MKLLIYTDPHICTNSSIVIGKSKRQEYDRYSARLSHCISTVKWINSIAQSRKVDRIICLGDLFDQPRLSAEEVSAVSEADISSHYILVGNHDISSVDRYFNSCNLYKRAISEVYVEEVGNSSLVYLPYIKGISSDILDSIDIKSPENTIVLSHNDIKGIYYGSYLSKDGIDKDSILRNCRLFINGHLHSGEWISQNRAMNLGTVTGLNFNNVSGWVGYALELDTETFEITWHENPYAFTFYDHKALTRSDLSKFFNKLSKKKHNIVQLRVPRSLVEVSREMIDSNESIDFSRIVTFRENISEDDDAPTESISSDISLSIFDSLRKFIEERGVDQNKYNVDSIYEEISLLEKESQ